MSFFACLLLISAFSPSTSGSGHPQDHVHVDQLAQLFNVGPGEDAQAESTPESPIPMLSAPSTTDARPTTISPENSFESDVTFETSSAFVPMPAPFPGFGKLDPVTGNERSTPESIVFPEAEEEITMITRPIILVIFD